MTLYYRRIFSTLAATVALNCLLQELGTFHTNQRGARSLNVIEESQSITTDLHSSHLATLPLQEWEQRSLQGLYYHDENLSMEQKKQLAADSCRPPPGIPAQCCIGTFAGMGRIITDRRHQCAQNTTLQQLQQLSQDQSQTKDGCEVCQLLETLRANNQTMAFVGDSMSHQVFQGLVCEFYRRNYQVQETSVRIPTQQVAQRNRGRRAKVQDEHSTNCHGINHCLHLVRTIQVSSPLWTVPIKPVVMQFFHIYRLPFADPLHEELVTSAADILVLNFGLHWGANYGKNVVEPTLQQGLTSPQNPPTPRHLRSVLTEFLSKIAQQGRAQQVLFRETSAQHFDADGGDYSFVKPKANRRVPQQADGPTSSEVVRSDVLHRPPLQCVPHRAGSSSGWRERVVVEAARQANYSLGDGTSAASSKGQPLLTILPFFEHTKGLHDLHPYEERNNKNGGGGGGDCTHYCSTPFLYMPLWKSIQGALH